MSDSGVSPAASPIAVPSDRLWFDPKVLNVAAFPQLTDLTVSMSVVTPLVGANVRRWGLAVCRAGFGGAVEIAPWPDLAAGVLYRSDMQGTIPMITLFAVGPLVSSAWWISTSVAGTVRVVELIRA